MLTENVIWLRLHCLQNAFEIADYDGSIET